MKGSLDGKYLTLCKMSPKRKCKTLWGNAFLNSSKSRFVYTFGLFNSIVHMFTKSFGLSSGCACNNHAQRCHFDQAVYEASGRRSGGVCEGCIHHTTGPNCDQCVPGYQPNPHSQMDRPDACIRK